jgi:hypothetical protein
MLALGGRCSAFLIFLALCSVSANSETVRNPSKRAGAGPLFQIMRQNKWGFMDRTGRIVIAPSFTDERDFFHGLAAVLMENGNWGYINPSGKFAIEPRFDEVRDFLEELAPVRIGRKWGYIDTAGRMVIEPQYQSAGEFHEGLARVHVWSKVACTNGTFTSDDAPFYAFHLLEDDLSDLPGCFPTGGKFGYIDKTGKVIVTPRFFIAQDFSEGLAAIRVEESPESKFGYIDRTGKIVIPARFNQGGPFSEGLAAVETSARVVGNHVVDIAWRFIDKTGTLKISDKYNFVGRFSEGLARVANRLGVSVGYVDHDGKMVIPAVYTQVWDFSEGLAAVCSEGCFYIDRTGTPVIRKYGAWWPFSDGLTVIGSYPPQSYIDRTGRVIAPYSQ